MTQVIDYYLFPNSPYAYMGHARLGQLARQYGAAVRVRPMDAAKVFPVSGGLPLAKRAPQRQAYRLVELKRWRDYLGVPLNLQPKFFPVAADPAARLIVAAEEVSGQAAFDVAGRVLAAVWAEDRDIAADTTLREVADGAGLDGASVLERSKSADVQARYDSYTQEAIDRQVFGAPTYVLRGELFWGQDRLGFLERALAR
jgi:2-hydroxychromene-2-carboxylate isomerase